MNSSVKTSSGASLIDRSIRARQVTITPQMAREMLERNTRNRKIRPSRIARYATDMKAGLWALNGETIIFDWNGDLGNGQHRLRAVIEADIPVDFMVIEGVDPKSFGTMDGGMSRTAGDVLSMRSVANASAVAAMLRIAINYRDEKPISAARTNSELEEALNEEPTIEAYAQQHNSFIGYCHSTVPLAACFIAERFGDRHQAPMIQAFITGVGLGANLNVDDPRYLLRNRLVKMYGDKGHRPEAGIVWYYTQRALNHFLRNHKLAKLQAAHDEKDFFSEIPTATKVMVANKWGKVNYAFNQTPAPAPVAKATK